jgi:uncharacterized iron-regulated membrane protein
MPFIRYSTRLTWPIRRHSARIADDAAREKSIAERTVTVVRAPSALPRLATYHLYSSGDPLFVVQAFDSEVAASALAELP